MEEVKIKKIDVENLKAVSSFTALFNGKCGHVTGANGFGKSTVIRALTDRLRGLKPSIITKIGESEGKTVMELTDGCRFEWEYNEKGKDHLNYFTPDTFKPVRRDVFKAICNQYFPNQFDINKFLTTTEPRKRLQIISELVDVDLTEIQARYKGAFDIRKDAKKELKILEAQIKPKPETQTFDGLNSDVEQKNVDEIETKILGSKKAIENERDSRNQKYTENKKANGLKESKNKETYKLRLNKWIEIEDNRENLVSNFNSEQSEMRLIYNDILNAIDKLRIYGFESKDLDAFLKTAIPKEQITYTKSANPELAELVFDDPMPSDTVLRDLESILFNLETDLSVANGSLEKRVSELSELSTSKQLYDLQLKQYDDFQADVKKQYDNVQDYEEDVAVIHQEIKEIISATKLPDEFQIDLENKNDILFRTSKDAEYLPITNETLASSAIFIAAFKLQANYLEAFRVAHFDVSYLDYENRERVLKEAIGMNIQLITESPAHDEKTRELQYILTED